MERLHVVVRAGLTPGQAVSQSNHAMVNAMRHMPTAMGRWADGSNTVRSVVSEDIDALHRELVLDGIDHAFFVEPDAPLQGLLTALVVPPSKGAARLLRDLPLLP